MISGNSDVIANNSLKELTSPVILTQLETKRKMYSIAYGMGWFLG